MAMMPTSDPTERSMFRDTMIRTIPVAMIAMPAAWTARVIMFVGWKNLPPLRMLNVRRIAARATSIPNSRRSISVAAIIPRMELRAGPGLTDTGAVSATFVKTALRSWIVNDRAPRAGARRPRRPQCEAPITCRPAAPSRVDPLAELLLGDPAAVDRHLQVLGGEWSRLEDERLTDVVARGRERLGRQPAAGATDASMRPSGSVRLAMSVPLHSSSAAAPAVLPSSLAFFKTSTYCFQAQRCGGWRHRRPGR